MPTVDAWRDGSIVPSFHNQDRDETVDPSVCQGLSTADGRAQAPVRRLESVETLGSTTFICTDKTGRLTRNEMAVEVWTLPGKATIEGHGYEPTGTIHAETAARVALAEVALTAVRCSNGRIVQDCRSASVTRVLRFSRQPSLASGPPYADTQSMAPRRDARAEMSGRSGSEDTVGFLPRP